MVNINLEVIKKAKRINAKCSNGFQMDIQHFLVYKEVYLEKVISLSPQKRIYASLVFYEKYDRKTGKFIYIPNLNVAVQRLPENSSKNNRFEIWEEDGLGKDKLFTGQTSTRKEIKILQKITGEITDELIFDLAKQAKNVSLTGAIVDPLPEEFKIEQHEQKEI